MLSLNPSSRCSLRWNLRQIRPTLDSERPLRRTCQRRPDFDPLATIEGQYSGVTDRADRTCAEPDDLRSPLSHGSGIATPRIVGVVPTSEQRRLRATAWRDDLVAQMSADSPFRYAPSGGTCQPQSPVALLFPGSRDRRGHRLRHWCRRSPGSGSQNRSLPGGRLDAWPGSRAGRGRSPVAPEGRVSWVSVEGQGVSCLVAILARRFGSVSSALIWPAVLSGGVPSMSRPPSRSRSAWV